jgi:hemolysin-activating ACP:hemolysin acyltransferase
MQYGNLIMTAPALNASGHSEAEIFGSIVWLASLSPQEWAGGDRMWVIDWMTPFGHSQSFSRAVSASLANSCSKSLYHRGGHRGLRIQLFRGDHVSHEQAEQWWKDRPILARRGPQLEDEVNRTSS